MRAIGSVVSPRIVSDKTLRRGPLQQAWRGHAPAGLCRRRPTRTRVGGRGQDGRGLVLVDVAAVQSARLGPLLLSDHHVLSRLLASPSSVVRATSPSQLSPPRLPALPVLCTDSPP